MNYSEHDFPTSRMRVNENEIAWLKKGQKELEQRLKSHQKEITGWLKSLVFLLLGQFFTFVFTIVYYMIENGKI